MSNHYGKWIDIVKIHDTGKTQVFSILPKGDPESLIEIGQIKWYPAWRKYAFFPEPNCVFESQCLTDIINFINELMQHRRDAAALKRLHLIQRA